MRITCPKCGSEVSITPKGRIRKHLVYFGHGNPDGSFTRLAAIDCSASGRDALDATVQR